MSDEESEESAGREQGEVAAKVRGQRHISPIWLVPIFALMLGVWMVIYTVRDRGPEIRIIFPSAEGVEAGETKIRLLNVEVGIVEEVQLVHDLDGVVVTARLEPESARLLREDTQFWVVRARIGARGISGVGTLLSGGYIELAPGTGRRGRRSFVGLAEPPITPTGTPGLVVSLVSEQVGSISVGDPILYKNFPVGRIESARFDTQTQLMHYRGFIEAPYDDLVTTVTRFWNTSGIDVELSAAGIAIQTGSLESLLFGGVAMGQPEGMKAGLPVSTGDTFDLYEDYASVLARPYRFHKEYVVRFAQSVRGLEPGAPVEYRGIRVGRVERLLIEELPAQGIHIEGSEIPVMIRLEPGRLELPDSSNGVEAISQAVAEGVSEGLRATLETGNLLTGSQYISIDFYPNEAPAEIGSFAGHPTIPSARSGLQGIQQQLAALLDNLNDLPLEGAVVEATGTMASLNTLLSSDDLQRLPGTLDGTLEQLRGTLTSISGDSPLQHQLGNAVFELDRTLASLRSLLATLEQQPNALIFNRSTGEDPRPPAGPRP